MEYDTLKSIFERRSTVLSSLFVLMFFNCSQDVGLPPGKIVSPVECNSSTLSVDPGTVVYGYNGFTEYIAGDSNSPIILTAPHGGADEPAGIPDRTFGVTEADLNTQELVRDIAEAIYTQLGIRPHVIINKLHRKKMDANRPKYEAAQSNLDAEKAWEDYHCFIDYAKSRITAEVGEGILWDIHGHGHAINRIEIGYLLNGSDLGESDAILNGKASFTSIRAIAEKSSLSFSQLVRGPESFGTLLYNNGYPSVPSAQDPEPGESNPFFEGGYTSQRHGSMDGGKVSAIQLEFNRIGVRDTDANRKAFAANMAIAVQEYLAEHFGMTF